MTALELSRARWDMPDPARSRLARSGARVAGLGLTTLATAGRLRRFKGANDQEGARERARVLRDASRRVLELHGVALDAAGPLPIGPALLTANHVSWLDPLAVASLVPCAPISKADLSGWPVIGGLARELGVVFFTRGDWKSGVRVLRAAGAALANGVPVLNFPEGTTTSGERVLPFRKGLFGLALGAGVPVVPVAIRYDPPDLAWVGDASFVPHYLRFAAERRVRAVLRFGAPILPSPDGSAAELAGIARDRILEMLGGHG
jgi:1-acyl-sn-glycerol-3-phosphate acyltransferase